MPTQAPASCSLGIRPSASTPTFEIGLADGMTELSRSGIIRPMDDLADLRRQLEELRSAHRDLDDVIQRLVERGPFDQLQMQRLKKRKLVLKDQIALLESKLLPDIIA